MNIVFDLETNGLLDHTSVDYNASPFKLKDSFKVWCAVIVDIDSKQTYRFAGEQELREKFVPMFLEADHIIGHNILDFDMMVMKTYFGIDYELTSAADETKYGVRARVNGKEVYLTDTLVVSKALNPDRYLGHSLDEWGKRLGVLKIDWRGEAIQLGLIQPHAPKGAEFAQYHPQMLVYNEGDCHTNVALYWKLVEEMGDHPWTDALELEHFTRDLITRQSHRGFWFDSQLAGENIRDLDTKMEAIRLIVEPLLPPKPMGVTKLKEFLPPKIQFKKDGTLSANILKWVEKHGGVIVPEDSHIDNNRQVAVIDGKRWPLPMSLDVPIRTHEPSTVKDTTHIKGWLVTLGWKPTAYKERDLTCDAKKNKLSQDKYEAAVKRYVEQTLNSPFMRDRLNELDTTKGRILDYLMRHDIKRPLKVYTNPTLTVGMEKEIDPALVEFAEKNKEFPHAKLVSEFLTYQHRRNSILGGGFDPDDIDEDDEFAGKGFMAADRIQEDGRIQTPADTCGAGTSRFKHRLVANIPRVTSLYGDRMRGLFGVDLADGFLQLGYDFDSLEAKIEAHYVYKYEGGPEYGVSLTAEKPNDCHSVLAKAITELIGRPFPRGTAKNVKYGCSYNAQPARVAKTVGCSADDALTIFDTFWQQAAPLKELKEAMQKFWETTGGKKWLMGIDKRKLPIRSKGNVINTAFQSAGVICAKRAMVLHEKKLKEAGIWVDFFRDDWKNKDFCQQLIAYHDEAQCEVRRSMVTFKTFPVRGAWEVENAEGKKEPSPEATAAQAAAKAYKKEQEESTGLTWSDVMHTDKMYYTAYCRAGELAAQSVREAGEYYKLNVPLSAGYMIGTTWATCH